MAEKTTYLFLDESGDHSLDKIDPQYPLFILGGALIDAEDYRVIEQKWRALRAFLFGTKNIILHTADMVRNKCGFEPLIEESFRTKVYAAINTCLRETKFRAIACAIRKDKHLSKYGVAAVDPYHLSLRVLVERAYFAMAKQGKLHIVAESRHPYLDRMLDIVFLELKVSGTDYLTAPEINSIGVELHIREKKKDVIGLQIADLLVSPIGRYVLGKSLHPKWGINWDVLEQKFYRYRGKIQGAGLMILPK